METARVPEAAPIDLPALRAALHRLGTPSQLLIQKAEALHRDAVRTGSDEADALDPGPAAEEYRRAIAGVWAAVDGVPGPPASGSPAP